MTELSNLHLYQKILQQTEKLALATSVDQIPHVRIVNFVQDPQKPGLLLFASDRTNDKVAELTANPNIAFTTVPAEGIAHVRSHQATVKRSRYSVREAAPFFVAKIPGYDDTIEQIGDSLDVFEIQIREAILVSGFEEPIRLLFDESANFPG